ncbi:hypothetical protein KSP39_PZI005168 [Platanthera zijinensis]|uniref:Uncharacterized protein n=1 Tax=Platanthera zijinensis TaxID=2320716 RepID=A0AAP0BTI9_9ASPA
MPLPKEVMERLAKSREETALRAAALMDLSAPARRFAEFGSAKRARPFPPEAEHIFADLKNTLAHGSDSSNRSALAPHDKDFVDLTTEQDQGGELMEFLLQVLS